VVIMPPPPGPEPAIGIGLPPLPEVVDPAMEESPAVPPFASESPLSMSAVEPSAHAAASRRRGMELARSPHIARNKEAVTLVIA
jgi:hypothetical protein